jgi:RNA polymerase sigma-70 factor (ECF subfamily)
MDPSDVVQDVLLQADGRLEQFLDRRPLPFYPWLRQLALERLLQLRREHLEVQKRSVTREECRPAGLPDDSLQTLAGRLVVSGSTPSKHLQREELHAAVTSALLQLAEKDRDLLVMRYLEQLPMADIAAVLGISETAAKVRHFRALQRLRGLLGDLVEDEQP